MAGYLAGCSADSKVDLKADWKVWLKVDSMVGSKADRKDEQTADWRVDPKVDCLALHWVGY
eukprot:scaffold7170_cov179-Ochromonas_danica.AAC.1